MLFNNKILNQHDKFKLNYKIKNYYTNLLRVSKRIKITVIDHSPTGIIYKFVIN